MTEMPEGTPDDVVNLTAETFGEEEEVWPELSRAQITYMINVRAVEDLGEALDVAATNLIRYGMDSFYIVATDPDTGREWIIHNGEIVDPDELEEAFQDALDQDPDAEEPDESAPSDGS